MFKILIDTCVWLDLAEDYQQQAILAALEKLIVQGDITLILPRTIVDEFARNKARIIKESSRSLSDTLKRAKEAVGRPDMRDWGRICGVFLHIAPKRFNPDFFKESRSGLPGKAMQIACRQLAQFYWFLFLGARNTARDSLGKRFGILFCNPCHVECHCVQVS
jgi:hypothetical protein